MNFENGIMASLTILSGLYSDQQILRTILFIQNKNIKKPHILKLRNLLQKHLFYIQLLTHHPERL